MKNYKINNNNFINLLTVVGVISISLFKYEYFGIFILLLFFINNKFNSNHEPLNLFYKFFPLFFYLTKFLSSLSKNLSNIVSYNTSQLSYFEKIRFYDLQNFFLEISCNDKTNLSYIFNFDLSTYKSCPYSNYWGPFSQLLKFEVLNLWLSTLITSALIYFLVFFIYIKLFNKFTSDSFLLFSLALSPPVNFLLDRMNIDIVIFVCIPFILKNIDSNLIFKLLILSIFIQYKVHPIILLASLILMFLYRKTYKEAIITFLFFFFNSLILINFYNSNTFKTATPTKDFMSFGLYSDSLMLLDIFDSIFLIYMFISICLFLICVYIQKNSDFSSFNIDFYFFNISVWFVGVSLYSNYDYRICILILLMLKIVNLKIDLLTLTSLLFIFLSPFPLTSNTYRLLENNILVVQYVDFGLLIILSYLICLNYSALLNRISNKQN